MTTTMKKRTRAEAKRLMWEFYRDNKDNLPKWIRECREEILSLLAHGDDVEDVFNSILESVDSDTELAA